MATVTLYSKPGCHLCEDAREILWDLAAQHPFTLTVVNILSDPALLSLYGERIPVVRLNDETISEGGVHEARLRERLREVN